MILDWLFGRPVYLPLFIDYAHGAGTVVMTQIYQSSFLFWIYKIFKSCYRLLTGTSELYRICDGAVQAAESARSKEETELQTLEAKEGDEKAEKSGRKVKFVNSKSLSAYVGPAAVYRIDRALLYSTTLTEVRRQLESPYSTLEEPFAIILVKKGFPGNGNPKTPQALILRQCITIIMSSYKLVHELNARAATKYDPTNRSHERKLLELWDLMMPDEKLTSRFSDQWQKIGFQGKDPATDFRGMGMLGLDNLHYYAKHHPHSVQRVLQTSHHPTAWFSMAIVGINITDFAVQLVRTRQLQHFLYTFGTTTTMFNEFYCYMFDEFGKYWAAQPMITVMDFGRVFEQFQTRIQLELLMSKETVLDPSSPVFLNSKKRL
ncbi:uncharacterized protein SPPG_01140 [Spizellomyces punctatus DAOM BR117]|uniref:ELMO domain-containing protein n=1 Tax=Spizellomyces punctatus (strain DAOM BR117) TaxID=645134 RepID=A0A0L0HS40_SPIPD|nr:uncharacterized protein SPPG_01140 [Spizellomyces punctatus DAOM BR117]KND03669.1 hypothetical protein SPPG_01140 [Spizellomyces punctatus DAOM BR117]|eukprot:XP_016611708.1 hypothetical protein SPPG_01140 [Spizellomyces punctatus DAOM BR117]